MKVGDLCDWPEAANDRKQAALDRLLEYGKNTQMIELKERREV